MMLAAGKVGGVETAPRPAPKLKPKVTLSEARAELLKRGFSAPKGFWNGQWAHKKNWTAWNLSNVDRETFVAFLELLDIMQEYKNGTGRFEGAERDGRQKGLRMSQRVFHLLLPETINLDAAQIRQLINSGDAVAEICSGRVFKLDSQTANLSNLGMLYQERFTSKSTA